VIYAVQNIFSKIYNLQINPEFFKIWKFESPEQVVHHLVAIFQNTYIPRQLIIIEINPDNVYIILSL